MNQYVNYTNKTDKTEHLGPHTIYPGQSKRVETFYIVGAVKQKAAKVEPTFSVAEFIKQKQDLEIEQLPGLSDAEFAAVFDYYQGHSAPKKLAPALAIEKTNRDDAALEIVFAEQLAGGNPETLGLLLLEHAGDNAALERINARLAEVNQSTEVQEQ